MKETFDQIEARLRQLIEGSTARLFSEANAEEQLAAQMVAAMRSRTQVLKDGALIAPNLYTIAVHPEYAPDVESNQALLETLAEHVRAAGEQGGLLFNSPPVIGIAPDSATPKGTFAISAVIVGAELPETNAMESTAQQLQENLPARAFLIVGGSQIFALNETVVNIGRKLDNQLAIDDPRISRQHAQLRAVKGHFVIFDLDSSGGTFVNGDKVNKAVLRPGDVISLAGVPLVYGQDAVRPVDDAQVYHPPHFTPGDHTTRNVPLDELDLDTFQE